MQCLEQYFGEACIFPLTQATVKLMIFVVADYQVIVQYCLHHSQQYSHYQGYLHVLHSVETKLISLLQDVVAH